MPKVLEAPGKVKPLKRVVFVTDDDMGQYLADLASRYKMKVTSVVRDLLVLGRYCKEMGDLRYDISNLKVLAVDSPKVPLVR